MDKPLPELTEDLELPLEVGGKQWSAADVVQVLGKYMTDRRRKRIAEVVEGRTKTVVPVVEGLYDMGNVSAVLRSAEALGCYSVHVVESGDNFKNSSRTSSGADKWLDVHRWDTPAACCEELKKEGYQIVVTHLEASVPLEEIDFTRPTAVVFGNEAEGISEEMLEQADHRCQIPMVGFVQSYNVSVAAALTMYHAYQKRTEQLGQQGDLSKEEKMALIARYYLRSVTAPEKVLQRHAKE